MTNATAINVETATAVEVAAEIKSTRGRKPLLDNRDNLIDSLIAIRDNDSANMPSRRTIMQLIELGHVVATEKERGEGQRGRVGSTYSLAGKTRSWVALMERNRAAAAARAKVAERAALVAAIADAQKAVADAQAALEAFDAAAQAEADEAAEVEKAMEQSTVETETQASDDAPQAEPAQLETVEA